MNWYQIAKRTGWLIIPIIIGGILLFTSRHAAMLAGGLAVSILLEYGIGVLYLRHAAPHERRIALASAFLFIILGSFVLLFLERWLFVIAAVTFSMALLSFFNYSIWFATFHQDAQLQKIISDPGRLIAFVSIFYWSVILFGILFYFGISTAYLTLPLLLIPALISALHIWFEQHDLRERFMHIIVSELLTIEAVSALLWLPFSYGSAALVVMLVYWMYYEFCIKRSDEYPHHNDRAITFLIGGIVLFLIVLIVQMR